MRDRKSVLDVAQVVADVVTELLQRCTRRFQWEVSMRWVERLAVAKHFYIIEKCLRLSRENGGEKLCPSVSTVSGHRECV